MHRKTIAVSCGEALAPSRVRDLFAHMDAEVSVLKVPLSDALAAHRGLGSGIDLFVVDATSMPVDFAALEESLRDGAGQSALLALVNGTALPDTKSGSSGAAGCCGRAKPRRTPISCRSAP